MLDTIDFDKLADTIDVPRHIIHLWTKKFPILSPQRSSTGKIFFKKRDLALAQGLKCLLIHEKQTIKDVQALLNERGVGHIISIGKDNKYFDNNIISSSPPFQNTFKESKTMSFNQNSIAKQAFKNLNNIFSKDKKKSDPILSSQLIIKQDKQLEETKEIIIDKNNDMSQEKTTEPVGNFEDNWRHLMEKEGKVDTTIIPSASSEDIVHNDILPDIWMIEDEDNLFDDENIMAEASILENINIKSQTPPPPPHTKKMHNTSKVCQNNLSIEQEEKIKHLIAKLNIMREEMQGASVAITKTLKAFGYSGFENAYNTFDQKSAY